MRGLTTVQTTFCPTQQKKKRKKKKKKANGYMQSPEEGRRVRVAKTWNYLVLCCVTCKPSIPPRQLYYI